MKPSRLQAQKNKKSKPSSPAAKNFSLAVILVFLIFVAARLSFQYLKDSKVFTVKHIVFHPSLKIMESHEAFSLKGKNLLDLDLKPLQKQLEARYPQFAQLRILKKFPDQLIVTARERKPFASVIVEGRSFLLDHDGIVLSGFLESESQVPVIVGVSLSRTKAAAGNPLEGRDLNLALKILKAFKEDNLLSSLRIVKMDVENLSQINIYLQEGLKIILDEDDFRNKLKVLRLVLTQAKSQLGDVKYIDVRFKEPILGKK